MMPAADRKPRIARRFLWFAIGIVVVIAGYTAAWHYAAGVLLEKVNAGIVDANGGGRRANCENAQVRGYPFRIGVFCHSVLYEDARAGLGFRARAFRSAAQIYAPLHVVAELDGPATVQAPAFRAIDVAWSTLRASVRLASPLPERVSMEGRDLRFTFDEPGDAAPPLARAETGEVHMRPAGTDLDLAIRFGRLGIERSMLGGAYLPPLSGLVDLVLRDGVSVPPTGVLRGRSGTLRNATVSVDTDANTGTGVTLRGPVAVDEFGLLDAELEVTLRNPRQLARVLGDAMPQMRQQIELGLSAFGSGGDEATLPLRIVKGEVSLGFLSLGTVPPL